MFLKDLFSAGQGIVQTAAVVIAGLFSYWNFIILKYPETASKMNVQTEHRYELGVNYCSFQILVSLTNDSKAFVTIKDLTLKVWRIDFPPWKGTADFLDFDEFEKNPPEVEIADTADWPFSHRYGPNSGTSYSYDFRIPYSSKQYIYYRASVDSPDRDVKANTFRARYFPNFCFRQGDA